LGEIRDEDTAAVLVRAALTGHLVFSTLHTNTAMGIIPRLLDMGLGAHLLCDPNFLQSLICQRLVPKLCQECAIPARDSQSHQTHLFAWQQVFGQQATALQARSERGCKACHGTGISGQSVVAEIIMLDEASRRFITASDFVGWERHLRSLGWESYRDKAKKLVANGLVDPLDAQRIVGELLVPHHQAQDFQYHEYN
jgi:general secretion pathway protein E